MSRKLDRAQGKLTEAAERAAEWERSAERLAGELAAAERQVGASALESGDVAAAARGVTELRGQVEAARQAVDAARAAQREAEREALVVEAVELRGEADKIDRDADRHSKRTRELLDQLAEHEGGSYVPDQPRLGVAGGPPAWTPKTERLRNGARNARRKAAELERRAVALAPTPEHTLTPEPTIQQPPSALRADASRLRRTAEGHERGARRGPYGDRLRAQAAGYRRQADALDEQAARAEASERDPAAVTG